jgi:hypothetical protein
MTGPCFAEKITDWFVFPHVFYLDENNFTVIYVQNERGDDTTNIIEVDYFDSEGTVIARDRRLRGANESAEIVVPVGFAGTAHVRCNNWCTAMAIWSITLPGQPTFQIATPVTKLHEESTSWAGPIPPFGTHSRLGLALQSSGPEYPDVTCSVEYFSAIGNLAATDSLTMTPGGTISLISPNLGGDFEGSLIMKCSEEVIPVAVVQNQINGFPTLLHLEPYYLEP